jgi:hypothetical protein
MGVSAVIPDNMCGNYNNIKQFCLQFINKFNKDVSHPNLLLEYKDNNSNFINKSGIWSSIMYSIQNNESTNDFISKYQYLVYNCIMALMSYNNVEALNNDGINWHKYYNMIAHIERIEELIYPSSGHFKLILLSFQKIHDILANEPEYFNNCDNCIKFIYAEFINDMNTYQLHYLHTIFNNEKFKLGDYYKLYPSTNEDAYNWAYIPVKGDNDVDIKDNINELLYDKMVTQQYKKNYCVFTIDKLYTKDNVFNRDKNIDITTLQMQDLIYIIGSPYYNLDERYITFISNLNNKQIVYAGF